IKCDDIAHSYQLRGMIYFDAHHFTGHVITQTQRVWFHDGIFTGQSLVGTVDLTTRKSHHGGIPVVILNRTQPCLQSSGPLVQVYHNLFGP
ncbi:hypothetical protein L208DRAFT_1316008, partial [Tricholoma matsutake]